MPDGARPRVFLVDDHELFLSAVRTELGETVDVVGAASEVTAAIELIRERVPDVVLVDVKSDRGTVRVEKSGPDLVIRVVSPGERVEIAVPVESVRRLMRKLEAEAA